jgi:hypothetical protein
LRIVSTESVLYYLLSLTFIGAYDAWDISYDAKHQRIRCIGHIINLSAQSFLFVDQAEALETTQNEMDNWRRLGPLGKLHNFVTYIGRTPQRKRQWRTISRGRNIARDNGTRWNSWDKMLGEAIPLQKAVDRFFEQYPEKELDLDRLSDEDWTLLTN